MFFNYIQLYRCRHEIEVELTLTRFASMVQWKRSKVVEGLQRDCTSHGVQGLLEMEHRRA